MNIHNQVLHKMHLFREYFVRIPLIGGDLFPLTRQVTEWRFPDREHGLLPRPSEESRGFGDVSRIIATNPVDRLSDF